MKIRKGPVDWQRFLCGTPAGDYVFQDKPYEAQIQRAKGLISNADAVIIGAGAGASAAAGFYPFPTEEAKWGYWSKHALMNRFIPSALPMYLELFDMAKAISDLKR